MYKGGANIKKENLYISTIDLNALNVANKYNVGLEIAEYCTAANMDDFFSDNDLKVQQYLKKLGSGNFTLHAPFNELSPAAIDPLVLKVTRDRYVQAINLTYYYGIKKIVIHSGFSADAYFPIWFEERSVEFWKSFLCEVPGDYEIMLENVFERDPLQLLKIVELVSNDRFKLCFDIGHANVIANDRNMLAWLKTYAPGIGHFHIHNNNGIFDEHNNLQDGLIPMKEFLTLAGELCPNATYTIETMNSEPSITWLTENKFI